MIQIKGDGGFPTSWVCREEELATSMSYLGERIHRVRLDVGGKRMN